MKKMFILLATLTMFAITFAQDTQSQSKNAIPGLDKIPEEQRERVELFIRIEAMDEGLEPEEWLAIKGKTALDALSDIPEGMVITEDDLRAAELRRQRQADSSEKIISDDMTNKSQMPLSIKAHGQEAMNEFYDAKGIQIPPEWVEELREAGVEMFTYKEMMQSRKQQYLNDAKTKTANEPTKAPADK